MKQYKTVGYFRKLGLEFVYGDVVDFSSKYDGSKFNILRKAQSSINMDESLWQLSPVESFVWREYNHGVSPIPTYLGNIEWFNETGEVFICPIGVLVWEEFIKQWRPHYTPEIITEKGDDVKDDNEGPENNPQFELSPIQLSPVDILQRDLDFYNESGIAKKVSLAQFLTDVGYSKQ